MKVIVQSASVVVFGILPGKQIPPHSSIACRVGKDDVDLTVPGVSGVVVVVVAVVVVADVVDRLVVVVAVVVVTSGQQGLSVHFVPLQVVSWHLDHEHWSPLSQPLAQALDVHRLPRRCVACWIPVSPL